MPKRGDQNVLVSETVYLDRDPAAAGFIHESRGLFDRLRPVHSDRSDRVVRPVIEARMYSLSFVKPPPSIWALIH